MKKRNLWIPFMLLVSSCSSAAGTSLRLSYFDSEFEEEFAYHFEEEGKILTDSDVSNSSDPYLVLDGMYGENLYIGEGTLKLPSSVKSESLGKSFEVRGIGKGAFKNLSSLTKLVLPSTLSSVGEEAFSSCPSLNEVDFDGDSALSYIGKDAFSSTPFLEKEREGDFYLGKVLLLADKDQNGEDAVSEGTVSIASGAFSSSKYSSLVLPDSLKSVGEEAFSDMENLSSADLKNASSAEGIFRGTPLESLAYSGDVSAEGLGLTSLKSVQITGKRPCADVLKNQTNLVSVDLSGTEFLLPGSFENDAKIESVTGTDALKFSGDSYLLTSTGFGKNLPDGDVYLGTSYLGTKGDTLPVLKENTTGITGDSLIQQGLSELPEGLVGIGEEALKGNDFTELNLNSLEYLGTGAFEGNEHLVSVSLGADCSAGSAALKGCPNVSSLSVPSSLSCEDVFGESSVSSLKSLELKGKGTVVAKAYAGCPSLENVSVLEGTEAVLSEAFRNCSSLRKVSLPDSLVRIGNRAFSNDSSLAEVAFSEDISLASMEGFLFSNDSSLQTFGWEENKVRFPKTLRKCGSCVFQGCSLVEEVLISVPSSFRKDFSLSVLPYAFSPDWDFDPEGNRRVPHTAVFVS